MNRQNIINEYSKDEFRKFLINDSNGKILELLNDEGIEILKRNDGIEQKICYILSFSSYKNELFMCDHFLSVFLNTHLSDYYAVLGKLQDEAYDAILGKAIEFLDNDTIAILFHYFNDNYKLRKLDNWQYSKKILYYLLKHDNASVIQKIIDNYDINLCDPEIELHRFFNLAKYYVLKAQEERNVNDKIISDVHIPSSMITKDLACRLWNNYDVIDVRTILNDAMYSTDISLLNEYAKKQEEKLINDYNETDLVPSLREIYDYFIKAKMERQKLDNQNGGDYDKFYYYQKQYRSLASKVDDHFLTEIEDIYLSQGNKGLYDYLKDKSDKYISNYIIDYHFEEIYYNIMLDLGELLRFYYNGNIVIPEERVQVYFQILNIDYLSIDEKKKLHNKLKQMNMIEQFYDDNRLARTIVGESIKEYSLTKQSLEKYYDKDLSEKYGVDVYRIESDTFFGVVKSGSHMLDKLPTGHSYSLIGNNCLAIYGNINDADTFVYDADDINPEQFVHIFPTDSYTFYRPFEYIKSATRRVNSLMTADELTNATPNNQYNELLILEKGAKATSIDEDIPKLKKIALYCLDEIRNLDVESAKNKGVGILLVNTKNFQLDKKNNSHVDYFNYNYYNGTRDKNAFESKRI